MYCTIGLAFRAISVDSNHPKSFPHVAILTLLPTLFMFYASA